VRSATTVTPEGQSNIIDIEAKASSGELAARVANDFSRAVLTARRATLQPQVTAAITRTNARLAAVDPNSGAAVDLVNTLNQLEAVKDGRDPTLTRLGSATVPTSADGASSWLVILLAAVAGFTIAAAAAVLIELLDPRLRREEEAVDLYPLPVLARIPVIHPRPLGGGPLPSTPAAIPEGFRTLHVQLAQNANDSQAIMVTSASAGDGKTTTVINLGLTIAAAGQQVVLIDLDMRNPELARALGLEPSAGLLSLVGSPERLADQLLPVPDAPLMSVIGLPSGLESTALVGDLSRELSDIVAEAKKLADFVLVDTSPLGEVSDALRVAPHVDQIVIVTRPGNTRLVMRPGNTRRAQFRVMRDMLDRAGYVPVGLVVIGGSAALTHGYYGVPGRAEPERADGARSPRLREA
jgi:hypothetical protein